MNFYNLLNNIYVNSLKYLRNDKNIINITSACLVMAGTAMLGSCSDSEVIDGGQQNFRVEFRLSRADGQISPENITIVAYRNSESGADSYVFHNSSDNVNSGNSTLINKSNDVWVWSNSDFMLPIGNYKLLVVYAEDADAMSVNYLRDGVARPWSEISSSFYLEADNNASLNVGEVFANDPDGDVFVSGVLGSVTLPLERVSTRLDFEFTKVDGSLVSVQLKAFGEKDDDVNIFTGDTSMDINLDVTVLDKWPGYNEDGGDDGFWNSVRVDTRSLEVEGAANLAYRAYVFKAGKTGNELPQDIDDDMYLYSWSSGQMSLDDLNDFSFVLDSEEIKKYHHKLVITCTPADCPELTTNMASSVNVGTSLADMEFLRMSDPVSGNLVPLSKDNYIASACISEDVLTQGNAASFKLERITGQLVFDFGRYSSETREPIALDEGYNTVFDGIDKVKVEVMDNGEVLEYVMDGTTSETRLPGSLQLNPWDFDVNSMVRLYGPYLIPDSDVNLKLTFYYGDSDSMVLYMPSEGKNISVVADCYTVSTVKIIENRIIDVLKTWGDVEIDTSWK